MDMILSFRQNLDHHLVNAWDQTGLTLPLANQAFYTLII